MSMTLLRTRPMRLLLAAAFGLGLLAAGGADAWSKEKVRIAGLTWPGYGFWDIIVSKNLAPDLEITYQAIEDPFQTFSLLAAGELEVVSSTIEFTPIAMEQGMPIKLVAYSNISYGTDKIIVRPDIKDPTDLRGKKVAVMEGGLPQIYMGIWLEQNGIGIDEVQFVNIIMDDAAAAFIGGDVAAAEFWEPYGRIALEGLPGSRIAADSESDFWLKNALLADAVFMHSDFIRERRDTAVKVMRALYDAIEWWKNNPTEGNKIIAEAKQISIADVELVIGKDGSGKDGGLYPYDFLEVARFCGVAPGDPPFDQVNGQIYGHFRLTNDWWLKFGQMTERVPAARGIDCSLLRELYETGYAGEPEPNW